MRKILAIVALCFSLFLVSGSASQAALTPNAEYTIIIQKMNRNGTVSDYSRTTATADATGKLSFTLSSMPTTAECNFMVIIIQDAAGNIVRKGFVPAPAPNATNLVGVNNLSTAQANAIIAAGEKIGTDDPIPVAYLLTILRSDGVTQEEAETFAELGKLAIIGENGFEDFLTSNGVTAAQLASFKSYLVYNPTAGKKTIADLTASFKAAVDSNNPTTAKQEMQKAGSFMADIFIDAAEAAGIELSLILAAHDAAGYVADGPEGMALKDRVSPNTQRSMDQAMTSFFHRIAAVKVKSEYTKALNTLNASGEQVTRFTNAVDAMMAALADIDSDYADYYINPEAYLSANGTTANVVQEAISQRYQLAFSNFQTAIESTNADITVMKDNVASAFRIPADFLPADFGKYYDFSGNQKNWPIPQTVMVNWIASILRAGGSFACSSRDDTPIPDFVVWIGSCSDLRYGNKSICESNGEVWTSQRSTFSTPSDAFNAYLGLQQDLQIIEMSRYSIFHGREPTREEEKEAKLLFTQRINNLANLITGTIDGTIPISADQKKAIVKLLMQPSMQ